MSLAHVLRYALGRYLVYIILVVVPPPSLGTAARLLGATSCLSDYLTIIRQRRSATEPEVTCGDRHARSEDNIPSLRSESWDIAQYPE